MKHSEKLKRMEEHLSALGIGRSTFAPPVYRLAWRLGFEIPPPFFASFGSMALFQGAFFGLGWGLLMWFGFWSRQSPPMPAAIALFASLTAGLLFGLIMAAFFRRKAKKLGLPPWSEYTGRDGG